LLWLGNGLVYCDAKLLMPSTKEHISICIACTKTATDGLVLFCKPWKNVWETGCM